MKYNIGRTGTRSHDGYIYYIRGTQAEQEATKLQESTQRLLKFLSEEPATSAEIYEQFGAMGLKYIQSPTLRVEHNIGYVGPRRCRAYFIIGSAAQTKAKEKLERLTGGKEWRSLKDVILEKLSQRPYYRSELLESICTSYLSNGYLRQKIWLDLEELIREGKILQVPADHLYSRKSATKYIVYLPQPEHEETTAELLSKSILDSYILYHQLRKKLPDGLQTRLMQKLKERRELLRKRN